MNNKRVKNDIKVNKLMIVFALFCFGIIIFRTGYLSLSTEIDGTNIKKFAANRNTSKKTLLADRGTIYDLNGEALAESVSSYTLIAYLDESRSKDSKKPQHVVDVNDTAEKLATVLDITKEKLIDYLSQDKYQVELGSKAKNLTELTKEKIEALNLSGIDFIESVQRYYPNGQFASYALGYAKRNDDGEIVGELGIEQLYNKELSGTNGYVEYQKDGKGYQIPNTKENRQESEDGDDIYLTIDSNVQFFVEQALKASYEKYHPEWLTMVVAEAKTGRILASSSLPSFDPNILDIDNYYDLNISLPFEPGSTMKIYTWMAAMEKGSYDGDKTYKSGSFKVDKDITIHDWNRVGWGTITFNQGFQMSSNVGVCNILNNFIDGKDLYEFQTKMGFGTKTNVGLANEATGSVDQKTYASEIYNAGFGQGITTTPMQHIRALTAIANDGVMLQPYIIEKIVDGDTGEVIKQNSKKELEKVASKDTIDNVKQLMWNVVNADKFRTGLGYKVNGYDIMGKTGTAQIYNSKTGKYSTDGYNVIRSASLIFPKDDPQIIIYIAGKKISSSTPLSYVTKKVIKDIASYYNIFNTDDEDNTKNTNYSVESYINKYTDDVTKKLQDNSVNYILLGEGNKIINQYPSKGNVINSNEKLFILTSGNELLMPNIKGYSAKELKALCNLLGIKYEIEGYGYVTNQSIKENTAITDNLVLQVKLKELYSVE